MTLTLPIPENEFDRVLGLSELDLDYSNLNDKFKDLTKLAARVAGTDISFLNLIDSFTQWTVSNHGFPLEQMPREESVCQYTIMGPGQFEVKDLHADVRFKDKFYVKQDPNFRYYFGLPLITPQGLSIGALCVLDKEVKSLNPEKIELLKIIADEIVNRIAMLHTIQSLRHNLNEATEVKKRVAHDIRGPIGGIIGLAQLISKRGDSNKLEDVLQFINLIQKSGNTLLELADEILSSDVKSPEKSPELEEHEFNLLVLKDKLEKLYVPQARTKEVAFEVLVNPVNDIVPFPKNKLLQITGNLISNAIKFTPAEGRVTVALDLFFGEGTKTLHIQVSDTGVGLDQKLIEDFLKGTSSSTEGTKGEQGYGFGLPLVKYLIETLKGTIAIQSVPGQGSTIDVRLPID
ncbi:GAF domain-containing sensor histidine kinase [Pontibacter sp. E15-1]|uniref:GAF domain-containing sensor histidine kinase n=1 Tax=Pontibacter sp. E15-1 TaxID=2919918 RepID=UPI001F4FA1DF|nr:GAF domain-containing sensor histidine kinase [Pontibacter sp. E15-1]MCJ8166185.1 GAF domain-containing sensor histidine kinase [Pontibacter sp. E15-1]